MDLLKKSPTIDLLKNQESLRKWNQIGSISLSEIKNLGGGHVLFDESSSIKKMINNEGTYHGQVGLSGKPEGIGRFISLRNDILEGQFKNG